MWSRGEGGLLRVGVRLGDIVISPVFVWGGGPFHFSSGELFRSVQEGFSWSFLGGNSAFLCRGTLLVFPGGLLLFLFPDRLLLLGGETLSPIEHASWGSVGSLTLGFPY